MEGKCLTSAVIYKATMATSAVDARMCIGSTQINSKTGFMNIELIPITEAICILLNCQGILGDLSYVIVVIEKKDCMSFISSFKA